MLFGFIAKILIMGDDTKQGGSIKRTSYIAHKKTDRININPIKVNTLLLNSFI